MQQVSASPAVTSGSLPGGSSQEASCNENEEPPPSPARLFHLPSHRIRLPEKDPAPLKIAKMPGMTPNSRRFLRKFFPDASHKEWNNWQWQIANRIRNASQISCMLKLSESEESALKHSGIKLPVGITPYYMSLVSADDPSHPLRRTVIPAMDEFDRSVGESDDPLGEDLHSPVPGLVHRYPDRVLVLVSDFCSVYCRYCTRSRMVGKGGLLPSRSRLQKMVDYVRSNPSVRDVLISGGDPLTLSDDRIDSLLGLFRDIPHVEILRIGTKIPAVLPQRVTRSLTRVLKKYHPLLMSLHFTHPDECTPESLKACAMLADAGIPLGSQTVLLKGVNDSPETMTRLMHELLKMRVKPYYIFQCDPISGSAHFRTPVEKGLSIIQSLRGFTSGYAVPTYVIDAPGGGGKVPLMPDYVAGRTQKEILLRNYENKIFRYHDDRSLIQSPL